MPPPGYEPFLHAICADPEDDTPRLVYADWLDENGAPERAEFIRLQIAFDRRRAVPARDRDLFAPRFGAPKRGAVAERTAVGARCQLAGGLSARVRARGRSFGRVPPDPEPRGGLRGRTC
ncbi:MAG: TIGR02996 domain-containing protein [Planctomycetes bacterium]|nr:TIGR02996 domain-containing protein [Planctomycetota bacterium]